MCCFKNKVVSYIKSVSLLYEIEICFSRKSTYEKNLYSRKFVYEINWLFNIVRNRRSGGGERDKMGDGCHEKWTIGDWRLREEKGEGIRKGRRRRIN